MIQQRILIAAVLLFVIAPAARTQPADDIPLTAYDLNQYVTTASTSPGGILDLDDNEAIARHCAAGCTRDDLRQAGLAVAESQLRLLEAWRLLERDGDTLRTTFPILGADRTRALRATTAAAAEASVDDLLPAIQGFVDALDDVGRKGNAYTMLFSYVLDDLVWKRWEDDGRLTPRVITAEAPFWAGVVWATYPPRDFSMGTNSISEDGVSFKVSWTKMALPKMMPFVSDFQHLEQLFTDYRTHGGAVDPEAREVFASFNLFDDTGRFTLPVIEEKEGNVLYARSQALAATVAGTFPSSIDLDALRRRFGLRDEEQATIIAYHAWMWDLMDALEGRGIVRKPRIFANPDSAKPSDVGDLVFVVKRKPAGL